MPFCTERVLCSGAQGSEQLLVLRDCLWAVFGSGSCENSDSTSKTNSIQPDYITDCEYQGSRGKDLYVMSWLDKHEVQGTQHKVNERPVNHAWSVRLLHHCSGCGSSLEMRHQRDSPVGWRFRVGPSQNTTKHVFQRSQPLHKTSQHV